MPEKYDLEIIVKEEDDGMTVRGILHKRRGISTRLLRSIANGFGSVYINGIEARFKNRANAGDLIGLFFPEENSDFIPQDIPIEILYEDDDLMAINKQPGLVVHPTKGHSDGTIANGLVFLLNNRGERFKIRFINRLDRDTSGVLLIGKNAHAQSDFARQGDEGKIEKIYTAIVKGTPPIDEDKIDAPIALRQEGSPERCVREDGAPSVTHYKVLECFRKIKNRSTIKNKNGSTAKDRFSDEDTNYSLLELRLETGRTHQIRVHLAYVGCPVLGDSLYSEALNSDRSVDSGGGTDSGISSSDESGNSFCPNSTCQTHEFLNRQALHATSLSFAHPITGAPLYIEAPLPEDILTCLKSLRRL